MSDEAASSARYWLSVGDGQSYGPYTLVELRTYAADGRVVASSQVCLDGTTEWMPAGKVLASLASSNAPPRAPGAQSMSAVSNPRKVGLALPIVATVVSVIFCCLPIGLGAILYASSANQKYAIGDGEGGKRAEASAKVWLWITLVLGGISAIGSFWTVWLLLDMLSNLQM